MIQDSVYGAIMQALGVLSSFRRHRNGLVLCLHSVTANDNEMANFGAMAIRREFLERMIVDLRRRGIALVSLSEALKLATGSPRPFIALTFDDGYRDNYEVAYPILKKFDVPFAIFLTTGLIDRTLPMWWHVLEHVVDCNTTIEYADVKLGSSTKRAKAIAYRLASDYFRRLDQRDVISATEALIAKNDSRLTRADAFDQALDWNMVREMAGSGLATFGGHTVSHPLLRQLDRTSLVAEIAGCRLRLRQAGGIEPAYFAYPFGQDTEVGALAPSVTEEAGFTAAFTTHARVLRSHDLLYPFHLPRVMLSRKAQSEWIVRAYHSGLPAMIRELWPRHEPLVTVFRA
ncbi:MAG TPA: polysaccharide deacetylase family protein [Methylocella sp.]|nr:polysaccharide deacetylase family protein [Methylocella sp.]